MIQIAVIPSLELFLLFFDSWFMVNVSYLFLYIVYKDATYKWLKVVPFIEYLHYRLEWGVCTNCNVAMCYGSSSSVKMRSGGPVSTPASTTSLASAWIVAWHGGQAGGADLFFFLLVLFSTYPRNLEDVQKKLKDEVHASQWCCLLANMKTSLRRRWLNNLTKIKFLYYLWISIIHAIPKLQTMKNLELLITCSVEPPVSMWKPLSV